MNAGTSSFLMGGWASLVNYLCDVTTMTHCALVLTGAGVSVSCGIPDFRSKDGVYARLAVDFPDLPDPQVYRVCPI